GIPSSQLANSPPPPPPLGRIPPVAPLPLPPPTGRITRPTRQARTGLRSNPVNPENLVNPVKNKMRLNQSRPNLAKSNLRQRCRPPDSLLRATERWISRGQT